MSDQRTSRSLGFVPALLPLTPAASDGPGALVDLAALRVVLSLLLLLSADVLVAPEIASRALVGSQTPDNLRAALGLAQAWPLGVRLAQLLVYGGAALGLLGLRARFGLGLAAVAGAYLLGLRQLGGAPVHCHHLLWFAALLALSPCDRALALRPSSSPAVPARLALRGAALLLGAVYLFPGLAKLTADGGAWLSGEPLRDQLYWKWAQAWTMDPIRVDRVPGLLQAGAIAVVAFELGAPLLLLWRRAWPLALAAGLSFHAATAVLLDVHFSSLWPLWVLVVPVHRWLPGRALLPNQAFVGLDRVRTLAIAALVLAVWLAGLRGDERGWPFARYPSFTTPAAPTMPALVLVLVDADGNERLLPHAVWMEPPPDAWRLAWRLAGIGGPVSCPAIAALWARVSPRVGEEDSGATTLLAWRGRFDVHPDRRDRAPERDVLLCTLPLPTPR